MVSKRFLLWASILLGSAPGFARGGDVAIDLLQKMEKALEPGKDLRAEVQLVIVNPGGETVEWSGRYYRLGDGKLRKKIVFEEPVDIRGIEISAERGLSSDVIEVYLPSVRRSRVLRTDLGNEVFAGTDFSYDQLGFEEVEFQEHKLLGEEKLDGRASFRIESRPKTGSGLWYGKIVRWIDKKNDLPVKTEYYAPNGDLYKVRTLRSVGRVGGYTVPTEIVMKTPALGTETWLIFESLEFDVGLGPELFGGRSAR